MKKVAVIDYGMGNLDSVARAVEICGGLPVVTDDPGDLESASSIILPGVGAFSDGMHNICQRGFGSVLNKEVLERETPFLGICLGMQLLATRGREGGETNGLGWINGEVIRLEPDQHHVRIPHIGWNEVIFTHESHLFKDIPSSKDFYFVHSYHLICKDSKDILGWTPYCGRFVSAVEKKNIFAVQFHPEKSLDSGLKLINNFLSI